MLTKQYQPLVDLANRPYQTLPILTGSLAADANSLGVFGLMHKVITIAYQTLPDPTVAV